ncbi:pyruvate kinase [Rodentibacter pneumotropicus]|uniref:Pyruvate kinase n=1 Tax=Rodentibacter pneumotropicus TaxID=758 RepID=A0A3S4TV57_9PAST|nr:pyruvate kinase [Rodentibacter pneumotropicus]
MLSEKEIEALKKGAYGIRREGRKARYIGENKSGNPIIARFCKDGTFDSMDVYTTSFVLIEGMETQFDIVGLWEDRPEPFNLERALAGEPVLLENGDKAFVKFQLGAPVIGYHSLVGYFINERGREERCSWFNDGNRGDNLKLLACGKNQNQLNQVQMNYQNQLKILGI